MGGTVKDHLGNGFANEVEMCEHHGVDIKTYKRRKIKVIQSDYACIKDG